MQRVKLELYKIKLKAISYRHYFNQKWEPKVGDFYVLDREDLEFFKIASIEPEDHFKVRKIYPIKADQGSFPIDGFATEGFGTHRCRVSEYQEEDLKELLKQGALVDDRKNKRD